MAKKLKIAILNITQGGVERGGEVFVQELSDRLSKNHKVSVISDKRTLLPVRWPIVWRFYLDPHGLTTLWFTLRNLGKIWKEKYDVVIPINGGWQPALVRLVTWVYGGKMVISGQSGKGWDDRNNLWCLPDVFVALTDDNRVWAKRACPIVRVEKIANGVDLGKFRPDGDKYKLGLKRPVVLCVAALVPEKRIGLIVEAVARLKNVSLLVVGKGFLEEEIKLLGAELMCERFKLISVKHDRVPDIYRACDAFVFLPSESEAFGIVYLEAMASGLPVVAIDDPSRREIVGEAGVFVSDSGDIRQVSRAILKVIKSGEASVCRAQAERYSWDGIIARYEKLLLGI